MVVLGQHRQGRATHGRRAVGGDLRRELHGALAVQLGQRVQRGSAYGVVGTLADALLEQAREVPLVAA